ncbi:hypothetical protein V6N13_098563 [Hibiscus sabdariffa]
MASSSSCRNDVIWFLRNDLGCCLAFSAGDPPNCPSVFSMLNITGLSSKCSASNSGVVTAGFSPSKSSARWSRTVLAGGCWLFCGGAIARPVGAGGFCPGFPCSSGCFELLA